MKTEVFLNLLEDPKSVQKIGVDELRELALTYPYSQVIQLLYGIRLRYSSEHLFNQQLGKAAALSNDRSVLFELFEDKPKVKASANPLGYNDIVEVEKAEQKPSLNKHEEELPSEKRIISASEFSTSVDDHSNDIKDQGTENPHPPIAKVLLVPSVPIPSPPKKKLEFLDAKPEGLENLSPQERVKAILERNRQLRQQFEEQKNAGQKEEKLFSALTDQVVEEIAPEEPKPEVKESTGPAAPSNDEKTAVKESAEESRAQENPLDVEAEAENIGTRFTDRREEKNQIESEEISNSMESSKEAGLEREQKAEEFGHNEDLPIDISDLIRRRYHSRLEVQADEEQVSEAQNELESTTVEEQVSALEGPISEVSSSESERVEKQETASAEEQSDLGMSLRIRGIRARLERLKQEEALSEEEMEALMEEHQKLEELLNFLPADDEHVFEVEVSAEKDEDKVDSEQRYAVLAADSSQHASSESDEIIDIKENKVVVPDLGQEKPGENKDINQRVNEEYGAAEKAANSLASIGKPKVEVPSSESEEEPDLEEEISRIEALAERLRYERQGVKPAGSPLKALEEVVEEKPLIPIFIPESAEVDSEKSEKEKQQEREQEGNKIAAAECLVQDLEEDLAESIVAAEAVYPEREKIAEVEEAEFAEKLNEVEEDKQQEQEQESEQERNPSFGVLLRRLYNQNNESAPESEGNAADENPQGKPEKPILKSEIAEKIDLIDAFVEKLPDLKRRKPSKAEIVNMPELKKAPEPAEEITLVTETLAKVYIKQGHFKKAIQAYEILKLKYPEKSSFFATRISEIKELSNSKK